MTRPPAADPPPPERHSLPVHERYWATEQYRQRLRDSVQDVPAFWAGVAREVVRWHTPFTRALDWDPPFARWFPDGRLNASENCLDRHLSTPTRHKVAYYWEGEPGERRTISYDDLYREVNRLASALDRRGFGPDDFATIYLPMVPELPVTMLALARLGIPFTTVFSGFSAKALADRINGLGAKLLFTADGGYRRGHVVPLRSIVEEALPHAPTVSTVVTVRRTGEKFDPGEGRDVDWATLVAEGQRYIAPRPVPSDHLLFLLYSSGTTGVPKAIAHGTGGYMVQAAATMRWIFDPQPTDLFWCAADAGWVTGHTYAIFGPLSMGATSILYEGAFDHPSPDRMWEMVERYGVSLLYTSPTALRGLRKYGDDLPGGHDLTSLRLLGTVGEAINPSVWQWYYQKVGGSRCPIVDTWWQTETGAAMVSTAPGLGLLPLKPGSATLPLPGIDVDVVTEDGLSAPPGRKGHVVVRQPWPGMLLGLYGNPDRYRASYWTRFPGLYSAGDFAVKDEDGYFWFLGRADEVLKVAGHRLGTVEIEDAILSFPGVAEAAVCGVPDEVKGEVPVAFVVLRTGTASDPSMGPAISAHVAEWIGKIARPERVHFVRILPKTRSGKIMRRVVKAVATGQDEVGDVTTLEDGASVEEVRQALRQFAQDLNV